MKKGINIEDLNLDNGFWAKPYEDPALTPELRCQNQNVV
jgi:hypothetical protein